jgi:hypothetical protein
MTSLKDLLSIERKRVPLVVALTLACASTGFATYAVRTHSVWLQWSVLAHIGTGVTGTFLLVPYVYIHFRRTVSIRRVVVLVTGLLAALPLLALLVSGWLTLFYGQREATGWVYDSHVVAAFGLAALVPLHVVMHVLQRGRRASRTESALPSVPPGTVRWALIYAAAVQLTVAATAVAYRFWLKPYSNSAAVARYDYSYGPHPFRPSQTETATNTFVDKRQVANSKRCISCHAEIAEQWFASVHRQSASDPAYVKNVTLLSDKRGITATRYCEGCHAPVALLSGELSPGGQHAGIAGTIANEEGVSCMGCHGIDALVHLKGVASYDFKPREDYLFEQAESPLLQRVRDLLIRVRPDQHRADLGRALLRDSKVCAVCHTQFMDKDFNDWGWVKMQDDYGAWLRSPYSRQHEESFSEATGSRCHDCHMPLVAADDPSADRSGRVRSHRFLGANTFLPILGRDEEHLSALKSFLQSNKLRISIDPPRRADSLQTLQPVAEKLRSFEEAPYYYYLGEQAQLRVVVSNRGVGHDFPGGTIDINEAWVEFAVVDAEGTRVFASGKIDADNNVDPGAYFYRSLPVDRRGELVWRHDLFNMVGESFRRVVKAGESDVVEYAFTVPSWAKSPLTVTATLKYRKLNDRYARWALGDKYIEIPAVDLAWHSLQVPIKVRREVD